MASSKKKTAAGTSRRSLHVIMNEAGLSLMRLPSPCGSQETGSPPSLNGQRGITADTALRLGA